VKPPETTEEWAQYHREAFKKQHAETPDTDFSDLGSGWVTRADRKIAREKRKSAKRAARRDKERLERDIVRIQRLKRSELGRELPAPLKGFWLVEDCLVSPLGRTLMPEKSLFQVRWKLRENGCRKQSYWSLAKLRELAYGGKIGPT